METIEIYKIAEKNNIEITFTPLPLTSCVSFKYENDYYIGIDPDQIVSSADECVKIAHDIGHCVTGSFYNKYAPQDIQSKHEYIADKWAIEQIISFNDLKAIMKQGLESSWELAEHFNVPEEFIHKTMGLYESRFIEDKMHDNSTW